MQSNTEMKSLRVSLLDIFMSDVLPLFPTVPIVPEVGHGDIKANTKSKGPDEDGGHVDTISLDECVVKGGGECHRRTNEVDSGKAEG